MVITPCEVVDISSASQTLVGGDTLKYKSGTTTAQNIGASSYATYPLDLPNDLSTFVGITFAVPGGYGNILTPFLTSLNDKTIGGASTTPNATVTVQNNTATARSGITVRYIIAYI